MRIAIAATHPIQYQVPWFRDLANRPDVSLRVFYALLPDREQQGAGFGVPFAWDVPLLDGYPWEAIPSGRRRARLDRFFGSSGGAGWRHAFAAFRPDLTVVTGWNAWPLVEALAASRGLGVPCVARGDSNALTRRPAWKRVLHRAWLGRYAGFLAVGKSNRDFYVGSGVPERKIFSGPHFVDNARWANAAERLRGERERLRARWSVAPGSTVVLFAGKLEPKKRVLDLIAAASAAMRAGARIHLLVAGAGAQEDRARAAAREAGLPAAFAGFLNQSEMPSAYAAADVLVLPSDARETWGLVVNEAMASGLPAIVSDEVGCGPDLVEEGKTGGVFRRGDVEELAGKIGRFTREGAYPGMGERARRRVASYSPERCADGTMDAARSLAGR